MMGLMTSCTQTEYDLFSSISGIVVDKDNGNPIDQVSVSLGQGQPTTYTGSDGRFHYKDIEAGRYDIWVTKTGYQANKVEIDAPSGETVTVNITMKRL